jgi:uncharacterized membrane protein YjjP (DUF1212 family)
MSTDDKLDLLIRAGALLLENGSVTYRVDETLTALGRALGLDSIEIFATPTGIVLGASGPDGSRAKVSRIRALGVNMNRMAEVSKLARDATEGTLAGEQVSARLAEIEAQGSVYPTWVVVIGVAVACGAFALLLGAGWQELAATVVAAGLVMTSRMLMRPLRLVPLMLTVIAAFIATAASTFGCMALGCTQPHTAQVATVLQLVPGVPMVTWIIDLATGDILSGVTRAAYGALIAMGVALGVLLFLMWGIGQ